MGWCTRDKKLILRVLDWVDCAFVSENNRLRLGVVGLNLLLIFHELGSGDPISVTKEIFRLR